jgi:hypothetical protein
MPQRRVFIIGPGQHVYDDAEKFGTRIDVLDHRANPFDTDELVSLVVHELFKKHQITEEDFIVLGGNAMLNAIAVAVLSHEFGRLNVLVYGAKHRDYTPRTIDLGALISNH